MALLGPGNTVLSVSPEHSPRRGSSCLLTIIAISGRAVAISAETSIHGCKSEIGAARSPILRPGRKLIRRELAYGARAMPADMLSCSAPPIDACAVSFHRFPQSVVTSRDCGGVYLTPCPPWSMLSKRMREDSRMERRRTDRRVLNASPLVLSPSPVPTPSHFIFRPLPPT